MKVVDNFDEADLMRVNFNRSTVEKNLHEEHSTKLLKLIEDKNVVEKFRHKMILCVSGYDNDSRELWEIPEVCRFFKKLDEKFPYWLHFMEMESDKGFAFLPMVLMENTKVIGQGDAIIPNSSFQDFLERHLLAVLKLHKKHDLSSDLTKDTLTKINQKIDKHLKRYPKPLYG